MKEENEKGYFNADSAILKIGSRPALWIISSIDDKTFIHTDSNSLNVYAKNYKSLATTSLIANPTWELVIWRLD